LTTAAQIWMGGWGQPHMHHHFVWCNAAVLLLSL